MSQPIELERHDEVFILRMKNGENRFNQDSVAAFEKVLDQIEASTGPAALVTVGEGKFYSNGLDLDWMMKETPEVARHNVANVEALLARVLKFPMVTVAALNGHAFAAGAMLALCQDVRIMREDRGYFCLPEIDIHMSFTPGMNALIQARMSKIAVHEAMITGKRYTAKDALSRDIVHESAPEAEVLSRAITIAKQHISKPRHVLTQMKQDAYAPALALLTAAR